MAITVGAPDGSAYITVVAMGNMNPAHISTPNASAGNSLSVSTGGIIPSVNVSNIKSSGIVPDIDFSSWLKKQDAIRCILVEVVVNVSGIETIRYLSTVGYITKSTDAPSDIAYLPIITGGVKFTESLDLESKASLSFGDIQLSNMNGKHDLWLDDVWVNRKIQVFIGDVRWDRFDFRLIFDGIVDNIDARNRSVLNIKIRDKLQRLNTSVTETKLGGTGINQDVLLPVLMGECFNVSPLLTDAAMLEYQVNNGRIERIIEVRDNGVPIEITTDLTNGKFTLNQNPVGVITVSAQGIKPNIYYYPKTVSTLIRELATNYGKASDQFTSSDIDNNSLNTFDESNKQPVGLYINSRTNVLSAINQIADSVGAQAIMSRQGKLRLIKIEFPPSGAPIELSAKDMKERNLSVSNRVDVKAAMKVGFCKNWTVQSDLQTGIPEEHKDLFADEWVSRTSSDAAVATKYKLDIDPDQKDTLLLDETDALTESDRLLDIYKTPRTLYSFDGYANLIELELGDAVNLTHNRFGLSGGETGMVTKLQVDWLKLQVKVGVLI